MIERRKALRHRINIPIAGWVQESQNFEGITRDISTSGAYILTNRLRRVGDLLVFLMRFPAITPEEPESLLWTYCRTVRIEPGVPGTCYCAGIATQALEYSTNLRPSAMSRLAEQTLA